MAQAHVALHSRGRPGSSSSLRDALPAPPSARTCLSVRGTWVGVAGKQEKGDTAGAPVLFSLFCCGDGTPLRPLGKHFRFIFFSKTQSKFLSHLRHSDHSRGREADVETKGQGRAQRGWGALCHKTGCSWSPSLEHGG